MIWFLNNVPLYKSDWHLTSSKWRECIEYIAERYLSFWKQDVFDWHYYTDWHFTYQKQEKIHCNQLYAYDIVLQKLEVTNWHFSQLIFHFSKGVGWDYTWMRFYSSEAGIFLYQKERKFSIQKIVEFNGKCHCNDIVNDLRLHKNGTLICEKRVMRYINEDKVEIPKVRDLNDR